MQNLKLGSEMQNYLKYKKNNSLNQKLKLSADFSTLGAGITSLIPNNIATIGAASCTILSAGLSMASSFIKDEEQNSEPTNINNFNSHEINSIDSQTQSLISKVQSSTSNS